MARARRPRSRFRTKWIVRGRFFAASLSIVTLVLAVLAAGQRYFYCAAMDRSAFVACCDHEKEGAETDGPAISEHAACCETRNLEANAPYGPQQAPPQLFAPLVAILPALFSLPELAIIEPPSESLAEIRAGPSRGEARAALQVYLC